MGVVEHAYPVVRALYTSALSLGDIAARTERLPRMPLDAASAEVAALVAAEADRRGVPDPGPLAGWAWLDPTRPCTASVGLAMLKEGHRPHFPPVGGADDERELWCWVAAALLVAACWRVVSTPEAPLGERRWSAEALGRGVESFTRA